mgnify:CR=1 FL=1
MITKETLKAEIDKLPDNLLEEVYKFINSIRTLRSEKRKLHTFKLKGQFDDINIRESAYE